MSLTNSLQISIAFLATSREENMKRFHAYALGSLVEETSTGVRLFVGGQTRDCDGTPVYSLMAENPNYESHDLESYRVNSGLYICGIDRADMIHGYGEERLRIIKLPEECK